MVDLQDFRNGMALLGGAVSVITTDGAAGRFGFTASAVCSVTGEPPTLLVCMNRSSFSHPAFTENGVMCVNVLPASHQQLSGDFASPGMTSEERFASHQWNTMVSGAPALEEALVSFDCRIAETHEMGSHSVFYGEILAIRQQQKGEALVYFNRAYHRLCEASLA